MDTKLVGGTAFPRVAGREKDAARVVPGWQTWGPVLAVMALAFLLYAWDISRSAYGNTYYAAAVRSMSTSWHNFFFGALDPGGFISVDKPPAFLWVGALSARLFGYSSWSILLPSAVAGAATVGALFLIVRRYFGVAGATVAAVTIALTPISVAVNRLNLPEPFMILALIAAAGALMRSFGSDRWWAWTAAAGCLVGVAFNIKMLAGWVPGPAFALAIVVATPSISWKDARRTAGRLAVLGLATLMVSASWMSIVDAWPAFDRPYVGGSKDNTVLDLAINYNGVGRVDGDGQGAPGRGGTFGNRGNATAGTRTFPGGAPPTNGARPGTAPTAPGAPAGANGFRGPGGIFGGSPGWLRMLDDANGGQIGWILPFALCAGIFALAWWRRDPVRRAATVLFLGWVITYAAVFSYAEGIYHSYYTAAMAPGVAALAGIGGVALFEAVKRNRGWLALVIGIAALTLWTQWTIAGRAPDYYAWARPAGVGIVVAGVAAACLLAMRGRTTGAGVALAAAFAGLLLLPGAWSYGAAANTSLNTTLPQAGPQQGVSGGTFGSEAFDDGTDDLAFWLQAHGGDERWQLVTSGAQQASRLIAEYDFSVMALGGFLGSDNSISVDEFAAYVANGDVRYVLTSQGGFGGPMGGFNRNGGTGNGAPGFGTPPGGGAPGFGTPRGGAPNAFVPGGQGTAASKVLAAVQTACTPVTGGDVPSQYAGSIYDCKGAADALGQAG